MFLRPTTRAAFRRVLPFGSIDEDVAVIGEAAEEEGRMGSINFNDGLGEEAPRRTEGRVIDV